VSGAVYQCLGQKTKNDAAASGEFGRIRCGGGAESGVRCALGTILNGGKVTTQITVKVIPANARPSVSASVTSATLDPNPANSSATITAP